MRQWFQLASLILILAQVELVSAHAVVTAYSLKSKPIHSHQADKVELTFNSKIELGLSQVYLVRKGDKLELLRVESGRKQGEVIVYVPALDSGEYAIKFKVFAADGHLTEDVIHFSVS